ncbi:hypothetical protein [Breoghania corrubedonensis]|uniref:hypothetical protein n=1 Tax=Breoghania corrubedonensis TaxID=665038 RepID=UPI000D35D043|nr:hypothetical protein [Breoghania corrubedonensis]
MTLRASLLAIGDSYAAETGSRRSRVSWIVFGDSKILDRIDRGGDLTTRRYERALDWFDTNWPEKSAKPAILLAAVDGWKTTTAKECTAAASGLASSPSSRDMQENPGGAA